MMTQMPSILGIKPEKKQLFESSMSGYHRICLEKPYRLEYISPNIAAMLGYSTEEIYTLFEQNPSALFEETQKERSEQFLDALAESEKTLSWQYKLRKKDGSLVSISEIASSQRMPDGKRYAISILTELSAVEAQKKGGVARKMWVTWFLPCCRMDLCSAPVKNSRK
jgi:PAS domain S-box-containing protein